MEAPAIALLQIEGTNCDEELATALRELGAAPERVHLKQLKGSEVSREERRRLFDYQALLFPGGFSAGDYVRAGSILAAWVRARLGRDLDEFLREGRYVGGICNGFQVLVEMGLLPGRKGTLGPGPVRAALNTNDSNRFECRPTYVRWEGGNFRPLRGTLPAGTVLEMPSAHGEGNLVLAGDPGAEATRLERDGQLLLRWVDPQGRRAGYPWNPNGSVHDIAGITNAEGNVFGLMPHPERSFFPEQLFGWTRGPSPGGLPGGRRFLGAFVETLRRSA